MDEGAEEDEDEEEVPLEAPAVPKRGRLLGQRASADVTCIACGSAALPTLLTQV